jgi:hypothetical protein
MGYSTKQLPRIQNHQCIRCGQDLSQDITILLCTECAEERRQKDLARVAKRKEQGLCFACGIVPVTDKAMCESCAEKDITRHRQMRKRRNVQGVCAECGLPSLPPFTRNEGYCLCEVCYLQKVSRIRLRTRKHWTVLRQKLIEQEYRCAYTGELLILGVNDSLEHICPAQRYPELARDPMNTEWVTREVNEMKRDRTPDEFLTLIRRILAYRGEKR